MRARPLTPQGVATYVIERALALETGHPVRIAVDGAPQAGPQTMALLIADAARDSGRPALCVHSSDFLRPASIRFEYGKTDPDGWYDAVDSGALVREVLAPLGPGGSRRYLPTLWDARRDRATRAAYETAPPSCIVVVDGTFLLRDELRWEFDLTVHLAQSAAALRRRAASADEWQLEALARYSDEVAPQDVCDVLIRYDDPGHPAMVEK